MSRYVKIAAEYIINLDTVTHVKVWPGSLDVFVIGQDEPAMTLKGEDVAQFQGELEARNIGELARR